MEYVNNEIFYHIQKLGVGIIPWQIGEEREIGKTLNPHLAFYDTYSALNADPVEACQEYYSFAKEYVVEEVRRKHFPDHPSRYSCLWMIPNTSNLQNALNYWLPEFIKLENGSAGLWILGLRCTGKIHYANEQYYINNPWSSFNDLRISAAKYWEGQNAIPESVTTEVLFTGTLIVDHVYIMDKQP